MAQKPRILTLIFRCSKNRIRRYPVTGPNQVWVADIPTSVPQQGFLYLALLTDKWSRKIVGFHLRDVGNGGQFEKP